MFAIRDCLQAAKSEELEQVRLTTVDNFQGEESGISLVRSNKDKKNWLHIRCESRMRGAFTRQERILLHWKL